MFSKIPALTALLTLSLLVACGGGEDAPTTDPPPEETPEATPEATPEPETDAATEEPATEEEAVEEGLPERLQTYLATFDGADRAKANPLSGDADAISAGGDEFQSTCFPCHGREGKGDGPAAKAMGIKPGDMSDPVRGAAMTAGEQYLVMKHGIPTTAMQPFGAALSDDQIWRVLAFVESLRSAPEAPEGDAPEAPEGG